MLVRHVEGRKRELGKLEALWRCGGGTINGGGLGLYTNNPTVWICISNEPQDNLTRFRYDTGNDV